MNCPFCQKPYVSATTGGGFKCYNHAVPVTKTIPGNKEESSWHFFYEYKDKRYIVQAIYRDDTTKWLLYQSGKPAIINLKSIPMHITPDNIHQKLPILLLFS